ncbi:DUF1127 domain-containing protein [Oceanicola granulosus]|nr:DUF1127 domain-containing protein [Oceanicola granulosus]
MAHFTDTRAGYNTGSLRTRLTGLVNEYRERQAKYNVYRRTVTELSSLTDRDLADLGVHRSQIRGLAHEAAYGK